jgi:hypothetical protein
MAVPKSQADITLDRRWRCDNLPHNNVAADKGRAIRGGYT